MLQKGDLCLPNTTANTMWIIHKTHQTGDQSRYCCISGKYTGILYQKYLGFRQETLLCNYHRGRFCQNVEVCPRDTDENWSLNQQMVHTPDTHILSLHLYSTLASEINSGANIKFIPLRSKQIQVKTSFSSTARNDTLMQRLRCTDSCTESGYHLCLLKQGITRPKSCSSKQVAQMKRQCRQSAQG